MKTTDKKEMADQFIRQVVQVEVPSESVRKEIEENSLWLCKTKCHIYAPRRVFTWQARFRH